MLKRTLLSSAAAVVLVWTVPAMAQSSHDQKGKTGQEMKQSQQADQHEPKAARSRQSEVQKDNRARSTQATESKTERATGKNAKQSTGQAKPDTTGQATHEKSLSSGKNTSSSEAPSKAASESRKAPENAVKSSQSKQTQPNDKAAQAPGAGTTGKQTGQENSNGPNSTKNASAPQNSGTASNTAKPSNGGTNSVEVQGANLSPEQRTKVTEVSQSIVSRKDAPRISNPDFTVSIGTVVPTHVHYIRVPETLVEVYPQWRDDDYFIVRDEIVIVDHSRRIVAVIPAGSKRAGSESTTVVDLSPAEITEVQTVLIERGYLHGRADGEWGPRTRDALITFQRKEGVEATGRIDERTVQSLGLSGKIKTGSMQGGNENARSQPENAATSRQSSGSQANRNSVPVHENTGSSDNANGSGKSGVAAGKSDSSSKETTGQSPTNGAPPKATQQKGVAGETNGHGVTPKMKKDTDRNGKGEK
jgi:hypothetical protein